MTRDQMIDSLCANRAAMEAPDLTRSDFNDPDVHLHHWNGMAVAAVGTGGFGPRLWLLCVLPEHHGRGIGQRLVRRLMNLDYRDREYATGRGGRVFFQACGFRVEHWDRSTGWREMVER